MNTAPETIIALGGEVKALGDGRVGGYILSFGSPERRDLYGDYFTSATEFGHRKGLLSDVYIHHRYPLLLGKESPEEKAALEELATRSVGHLDVVRMDEVGLWAEHVLDMADEYQRRIYEMVQAGKLKYSTGTAPHLYNRDNSGEIKTWVIAEASLTPTPAEWRATNVVVPIRSLSDAFIAGMTPEQFQEALEGSLKRVSNEGATGSDLPEVKSALLGESIEAEITLGAVERLFWQFQWALWTCLSGHGLFSTAGIEQRVAYAGALVDEFSQITKRVIAGINLSSNTAELAAVAKAALATLETIKAGRVLSTKNESDLRTASDLIAGVLKQVESQEEAAEKAEGVKEASTAEVIKLISSHIEQYNADIRELLTTKAKADASTGREPEPTNEETTETDTTQPPPVRLTTGSLVESLRRITTPA
ncbi:MAG: hypothetical protein IPM61_16835 [Chlorobi bacterium]|nr:hypothetical protein [Chlorobiota bacterium]